MKNKITKRQEKLFKKSRARAYKRYYKWLSKNKNIRSTLEIPLLKFKKVR